MVLYTFGTLFVQAGGANSSNNDVVIFEPLTPWNSLLTCLTQTGSRPCSAPSSLGGDA